VVLLSSSQHIKGPKQGALTISVKSTTAAVMMAISACTGYVDAAAAAPAAAQT
jgi:hypothetical protein